MATSRCRILESGENRMKLHIQLKQQNNPKFPDLFHESGQRFYDLSHAQMEDGCVSGIIKSRYQKLPSIIQDPGAVLHESFRVMTLHGILTSRGYRADYYDNGENDSMWARDVDIDEPSIKIPLTVTQRKNLYESFIDLEDSTHYEFNAKVANWGNDLFVTPTDSTLARIEKIWDIGKEDTVSLELLVEQSLKCLGHTIWDCHNGYLNVYSLDGKDPRTLTDFRDTPRIANN